jgi:error-prone DNA polymerase
MHRRGRRALQDTLTAIRLRTTVAAAGRGLYANGERRLRPIGTLAGLYPAALLAESACIAARCDFSLDSLRYEYPGEIVPPGESPAAYLRRLTEEGARRRWPGGVPDRVRALIEHELELIGELAYEPYFLTVHDIVQFARARGILCQGRGSAANSAVCFCLGITEVDPARMDMLFERFISRERNEPPDIDVDFEHERREEVIQYIYRKYGRDRAALAATVISYRGRSAVRDVGKALGLSPGQVDRLARSLQWWDGGTIVPERLAEAGLDPDNPVIRRVVTLAHDLAGFPRHLSQHVGGFVVSRGPLSRLVPIENAAMAGRSVIQWDKDDLDALGLLKVDCLALGMLTAIHRALDLLRAHRGRDLTLATVPAEDPEVYAMIQRADTVGVFQIESRAQMAMLPRLRPACFYDLVIEVAIVRPGPIQGDMVHPYLRRRQGLEAVSYPNDAVRAVLERTLGVPIFQEQVIKLAMVAAGFSPGEADGLRRSMAAWKRNGSLGHYEQRLIEGMRERGYSEDYARRIFQQIQGFGEYGFPESHSASFALLVYVSAWLKRFEPAAFACALLNSQPMGFYAPDQLVQDARRHGVEVRGVDVRVSDWDCTLENSGEQRAASSEDAPATQHSLLGPRPSALGPAHAVRSTQYAVRAPQHSAPSTQHIPPGPRTSGLGPPLSLRLGLRLVKGLSHSGAQRLVAARAQAPFADVEDIARRARLDRRDLQALAAADALAGLSGNRHQAQWAVCGIEEPAPLFRNNEARGPRSEVRVADSKAARDTVRSTQYAVRATQHPTPSTQHSLLGPRTSDPGPDHAVHSTRYERRNPHSNAEACGSGLPTAISAASPSRPGGRSHSAECEHAPLGPRTSGLGPAIPLLRPPTEGENIVADYASLGLTLRRHPLAVIRDLLDRRGLLSAQAVWDTAHAETVRTAGLVVCRQCPSSSSGVIFATLEDETGNSQVIVWPRLAERQRRVLLTARLLGVTGTVQREGEVLHVIASGLQDYSGLLGRLVTRSRDFQ